MKKFLIMAAMVLSSVGAFAQYSAGDITIQPKIGLNCSTLSGEGSDYKAGFVGGVEAEYHVSPLVGISAGVLYSMQGAKAKNAETDEGESFDLKMNFAYINIPILANFYVANGLALKAGIQPAFKASAKVKVNDTSLSYDDYFGGRIGKSKSFDFSIPVGISYEYANICLDARYNIGVTKITEEKPGYKSSRNNVFQLTLGYKFKL